MPKRAERVKVCIIIPAYNEGPAIQAVVRNARKHIKKSPFAIDIVVVNDGSHDQTGLLAAKAGATVIDHILNMGVGGATTTGLAYARHNSYAIAATMDADGQHAIEDVLRGIEKLSHDGSDLLIGSRLIDSAGMSSVKRFGNKGLSFFTYVLFGINSTDSQSGLRIYSRKAIEQLHWRTNGYEFCSEMLWRAKQLNLTVDEYPIQAIYTDYSRSKGQNNWNAVNIMKSLLKRRVVEFLE